MGIDNLLFICPLLRHLAGKANEGINVENFEHLVDGDFEIDGEFMPWDINTGDTGGTDMVNWKEAFETALAAGGNSADFKDCAFCRELGVVEHSSKTCSACPLYNEFVRPPCYLLIEKTDSSERRAICRHVLATVEDWTEVAEIRARIAEMLDEETRRKFLGKAKECEPRYWMNDMNCGVTEGAITGYENNGFCGTTSRYPVMRYTIFDRDAEARIIVCRDEDMAYRILEFLNREAE